MDSHGNERDWRTRERASSSGFDEFRDYRGERDRWGNPLPDGRPGIWGSTYTPRYDRGPGDQPRRAYDSETRDYGPLASPEYREPGRMPGTRSYSERYDDDRYGNERYGDDRYGGRSYGEDDSYPRLTRLYGSERGSGPGSRYPSSRFGGEAPRPEDFLDERDKSWSGQLGRDPYAPEPGGRPVSAFYAPGDGQQSGGGEHSGRGPRNYRRDDGRIHEDVCEMLTRHGNIDASDVEVEVKDGEVCLRGSVETRAQKRLAEDIAWQASGVRDVRNEIRAQTMMAERGERSITVGEGALSSRRGD